MSAYIDSSEQTLRLPMLTTITYLTHTQWKPYILQQCHHKRHIVFQASLITSLLHSEHHCNGSPAKNRVLYIAYQWPMNAEWHAKYNERESVQLKITFDVTTSHHQVPMTHLINLRSRWHPLHNWNWNQPVDYDMFSLCVQLPHILNTCDMLCLVFGTPCTLRGVR